MYRYRRFLIPLQLPAQLVKPNPLPWWFLRQHGPLAVWVFLCQFSSSFCLDHWSCARCLLFILVLLFAVYLFMLSVLFYMKILGV